jgi:hypothetical protein
MLISRNLAFNILEVNKAGIHEVMTKYYEGVDMISAKTVAVTGTEEFVAYEWVSEFVTRNNQAALRVKGGERTTLKGVSLIWWRNEGGSAGYPGWKVVKWRDYTSHDH